MSPSVCRFSLLLASAAAGVLMSTPVNSLSMQTTHFCFSRMLTWRGLWTLQMLLAQTSRIPMEWSKSFCRGCGTKKKRHICCFTAAKHHQWQKIHVYLTSDGPACPDVRLKWQDGPCKETDPVNQMASTPLAGKELLINGGVWLPLTSDMAFLHSFSQHFHLLISPNTVSLPSYCLCPSGGAETGSCSNI